MIRLAVRCHAAAAELALAELIELAPSGIEEVHDGDIVEYAVYGPPGELPELPDLKAAAGDALVEVRVTEVPDDLADRWRSFHRPVTIGDRLHVRPSWEPPSELPGIEEIVIDPGQAFGTGSHATTRLCLELLLGLPAGGALVDLGCGTGVLAIAAARLGFAPVRCLDFDDLAVDATRANAAANDVTLTAERFDLRDGSPPSAPTVVANLLRPLLLTLASKLAAAPTAARPERMILSGLLDTEADEIRDAFAALGCVETARRAEGGWTALALALPGDGRGDRA